MSIDLLFCLLFFSLSVRIAGVWERSLKMHEVC
jgi:hypothetical protein